MASVLYVHFLLQAKGIMFHGSLASIGQYIYVLFRAHNRSDSNCVALMLLSGMAGVNYNGPITITVSITVT